MDTLLDGLREGAHLSSLVRSSASHNVLLKNFVLPKAAAAQACAFLTREFTKHLDVINHPFACVETPPIMVEHRAKSAKPRT